LNVIGFHGLGSGDVSFGIRYPISKSAKYGFLITSLKEWIDAPDAPKQARSATETQALTQ